MKTTDQDWQYQSRESQVLFVILVPFFSLVFLSMDLREPNPLAIVVFSGIWLAIVAVALRLRSSRVIATRSGVTLKNILRTHRLAWDELRGFSLGRRGFNPAIGVAETTAGQIVTITAIQAPPLWPHSKRTRRALDAIEHLNAELANYLGAQGGRRTV
jgi:hypothetical protein